ncbi:glycoside hydrolase family 5 protein [Bacillus sp. ISL-75]|uniref:glycoside hydrolase family 5 protein n=1 Tax=Bacillus sp. ISL-75 TaxID=2819137 RepID=UPI001BE97D10|nr:glycoside hydrolase family 5 protein [Bacillus sp. ISL-75]MBT2730768.1 glycoside hydrolase family 5 protein [Bacillus sp. ISL-75]
MPEGYMWKLYTKCDRPRRMEKLIEEICGRKYAEFFWEKYFTSYITENDIKLIADQGYNSVRLPLNARHLYDNQNGKIIWKERGFSYINLLIKWCKKHEIYVILDMHGAPGGQTGTNIDDSQDDQPELFIQRQYQLDFIALWKEIAARYSNEPIVAGYDLLNEPLPNWFSSYNNQVVPLYKELIHAIRSVDNNHLIIIEGVHWATDFSIFDSVEVEKLDDNVMLQFHKYWSPPDQESLQYFLDYSEKLNLPLFMGEGGENNLMWYSAIFPLYDRLNISWSFWTYKKMDCTNSPVSFAKPSGWEQLIEYIDGKRKLSKKEATKIFNHFLQCIQIPNINHSVFRSLQCQAPIRIHCEFYVDYSIKIPRQRGAHLRSVDSVSILFENGKEAVPDYKRYGGEAEPQEENVIVKIHEGESLTYEFRTDKVSESIQFSIRARGKGQLQSNCKNEQYTLNVRNEWSHVTFPTYTIVEKGSHRLNILCSEGSLYLDYIDIQKLKD